MASITAMPSEIGVRADCIGLPERGAPITTRVLPTRAPGAVSRRSFLRTSPTISTRSPSCVLTRSMSFRGPFRRKLRPVTFGPRRMKSSRGCVAVNTRPFRQPVVAISTESSGIFFSSGFWDGGWSCGA